MKRKHRIHISMQRHTSVYTQKSPKNNNNNKMEAKDIQGSKRKINALSKPYEKNKKNF